MQSPPGDPQINALIDQARELNRKDGFPDDDVWVARRLAAVICYLAPRVSRAMFYGNTDWSRFKPPADTPDDNTGLYEMPKHGER